MSFKLLMGFVKPLNSLILATLANSERFFSNFHFLVRTVRTETRSLETTTVVRALVEEGASQLREKGCQIRYKLQSLVTVSVTVPKMQI